LYLPNRGEPESLAAWEAGDLVNIQRMVAAWRRAWSDVQHSPEHFTLLSVHRKKWADQVLEYSGMLEE